MGSMIALLDKKGGDATEPAFTMLNNLSLKKADACGLASPSAIRTEESLAELERIKLNSNIIIGHALSRILPRDKEQPLQIGNASLVFEGRIFPTPRRERDVELFARQVLERRAENAKKFIRETEGDFVFAIVEPEKLTAGRDVLGARPLYYGENALWAGLSSERKALWAVGIREVNSFPPGTVAEVSEKGFKFKVAEKITCPSPRYATMKDASRRLQNLLRKSVSKRTAGLKEVAVAFSGGLDSSIIAFLAKKSGVAVQLVHVSLANQSETNHAKTFADELKLPIHSCIYTENDVLETLPSVLRLIEEADPVKTSIGIPFYWTAERAAEMNLKVILAGQGADELFGGYRKYVDDYIHKGRDKAQQTIFQDVVNMYQNNLERDFKICNFNGLELRLPFTTRENVNFALSLPLELKLQPNENTLRKLVLRTVGRNLGLPQSVVDRPKKAMQYATGVSKVLDRTAKSRNLSTKEYLNSVYQTVFPRMTEYD